MPMSDPGPPPRPHPDHFTAGDKPKRMYDADGHPIIDRPAIIREHLETAEAVILSWSRALEEDDEPPSVTHILFTVLTHISRAAGILEED